MPVNLVKRNANLVIMGGGGECSDLHELSNIDDPTKEERRKIEEMAWNGPTDSIYRGKAFDKRSPLGNSTPRPSNNNRHLLGCILCRDEEAQYP